MMHFKIINVEIGNISFLGQNLFKYLYYISSYFVELAYSNALMLVNVENANKLFQRRVIQHVLVY